MKRLFTLLLISFAALPCKMIDEKLDDFLGRDDSSVTTIANNQIWYISTDGEIVEPRSEWYNNYADAHTTFGVNIVSNTYVDGKGVIEFDGNVTTIGKGAFAYCSSLQEFNGKFASEDGRCLIIDGTLNSFAPVGLTEYTIPDSVTAIGYAAFAHCDSLTSVTIGDSVTAIGYAAFAHCDSLTSVTIGDSVTTIGRSAFNGCTSLTSVYCKATTPPAFEGTSVFNSNGSGRKIYVPMESVEAYKSAYGLSDYALDIVGYNF